MSFSSKDNEAIASSSSCTTSTGTHKDPDSTKFHIDPQRATTSMSKSLQKVYNSLRCPICHNLMTDPTTLSCTHSFCLHCISTAKQWTCVVPGCNMPVTIRGKKSYVINPQLASVVTSLRVIQETINGARPQWWKCSSMSQNSFGADSDASPSKTIAMDDFDLNANSMVSKTTGAVVDLDVEDVVDLNPKPKDDSDATTVDGMDDDSFASPPILKKRKIQSKKEKDVQESNGQPDEQNKQQEKPSLTTITTARRSAPANAETSTSPKKNPNAEMETIADDASIATQPYEISRTHATGDNPLKTPRKNINITDRGPMDPILHDSFSHEIVLSANQTPQEGCILTENEDEHENADENVRDDLNKSCAIPDVSFRLSPIAMSGSQSQSQSRRNTSSLQQKRVLNDISEEMSAKSDSSDLHGRTSMGGIMETPMSSKLGGTTEEIDVGDDTDGISTSTGAMNEDSPKLKASAIPLDPELRQNREGQDVSPAHLAQKDKTPRKLPVLKDLQDNVPLQIQKTSSTKKSKKGHEKQSSSANLKAAESANDGSMKNTNPDSACIPPIPQIFLISPSCTLSASDQRCIRKLVKNERLEMLHSEREGNENCSDVLDINFNFDEKRETDAEITDADIDPETFLRKLYTMDRTSHYPVEYSYAICSNAEYQMFEGYIMPRSFRYVLAVACGLSIIDIQYLRKAASVTSYSRTKYLYAPGTAIVEDIAAADSEAAGSRNRRKRGRGKDQVEKEENYHVAGDVNSTEFMGPQRSRKALLGRLEGLSNNNYRYNNGLLTGYTVLLYGQFDAPPAGNDKKKPGSKGRKGRAKKQSLGSNESSTTDDMVYTKGRIKFLLNLCGAFVGDLSYYRDDDAENSGTEENGENNVIILTRKSPDSNLSKSVRAIVKSSSSLSALMKEVPIVPCRWLEDSISAFQVKNIADYQ